jgi:hypothetical protein
MTSLPGFYTPERHLHEKQSTRSNLLDHDAERSNAFGNVWTWWWGQYTPPKRQQFLSVYTLLRFCRIHPAVMYHIRNWNTCCRQPKWIIITSELLATCSCRTDHPFPFKQTTLKFKKNCLYIHMYSFVIYIGNLVCDYTHKYIYSLYFQF